MARLAAATRLTADAVILGLGMSGISNGHANGHEKIADNCQDFTMTNRGLVFLLTTNGYTNGHENGHAAKSF